MEFPLLEVLLAGGGASALITPILLHLRERYREKSGTLQQQVTLLMTRVDSLETKIDTLQEKLILSERERASLLERIKHLLVENKRLRMIINKLKGETIDE